MATQQKPAAPVAPKPAAAPKPPAVPVTGAVRAIMIPVFASLPLGESAIVAGVLKGIKEKEGNYGPITAFKGTFAARTPNGDQTAKLLYLPEAAKIELKKCCAQIGKWDSLEFKVTVTRSEGGYSHTFDIAPRAEQSKALFLLNS